MENSAVQLSSLSRTDSICRLTAYTFMHGIIYILYIIIGIAVQWTLYRDSSKTQCWRYPEASSSVVAILQNSSGFLMKPKVSCVAAGADYFS